MTNNFILFFELCNGHTFRSCVAATAFLAYIAVCLIATGCNNDSSLEGPRSHASSPTNTHGEKDGQSDKPKMVEAKFVDDRTCAECHADIFETFQHVAMSTSFYDFDSKPIVEDFCANHFYHPPSDNHYEMNVVDGQFQMTRYKERSDGSKTHSNTVIAQYVVGSGNHVRTYIHRNENGEMFQLPVVWYSQENKWGMAPGYDRPDHLDFGRPITRHCMFCHNGYPEFEPASDQFGMPHLFPKKMPQGIGCQRCHGPGAEHIRIAEAADADVPAELKRIQNSIVNSAKLTPQLQDDVCNQCHLQPSSQRSSIVHRFGKGDYSYIAGQPLEDHLVHFELDRHNELTDHFEINHHPYRLRQSKCYIESENGIRCTHCHDPHSTTPVEKRLHHYRKKCLACHESNDCLDKDNGRLPDSNCVSCHMPDRRTSDVIHVTMTDHKIARNVNREKLVARRQEIDASTEHPIRPFSWSKNANEADDHKAYELFSRALDSDATSFDGLTKIANLNEASSIPKMQLLQGLLQHKKFQQAEELTVEAPEDAKQLSSFQTNAGIAALGTKKFKLAIHRLELATTLDPKNANAWHNLGAGYVRTGNTKEAELCLKKAIELRPSYVKSMLKLGSVYALQDEYQNAAAQFENALRQDVRNIEAYSKLSAVKRRTNEWKEAIQLLQDASDIAPDNRKLLVNLTLTLLEQKNKPHRNTNLALATATKLETLNTINVDFKILKTMALLQANRAKESMKSIATILNGDKRKPEAGLLLAVSQKQLQSYQSANENYAGAKSAISNKPMDRVGRVVLEYANAIFDSANQND